jgi:hypothetical protein
MNLGTISLILGSIASFLLILGYLYKGVTRGVKHNKARTLAQQGRIAAIANVSEYQGLRLGRVEKHLSLPEEERGKFYPDEELITLENKAMDEYESHHTNLTGLE